LSKVIGSDRFGIRKFEPRTGPTVLPAVSCSIYSRQGAAKELSMDLACKTRIATVYYLDREGKFPRSVEIACILEDNKKCKEETNECKQVFWNHKTESEIHHFCACVGHKVSAVDFGPPVAG
jgi:hypothetical protein